MAIYKMHDATLCYLIKDNSVLLGLKKRGFAKSILNGYGGKVHDGEIIETAAVRELKEECSVAANLQELEKVAIIEFYFTNPEVKDKWSKRVHVYLVREWRGEPVETEEMEPRWYRFGEIPYDKLWSDDKMWLPQVLQGKKLRALFRFGDDNNTVVEHKITTVDSL
ncbi:8-oxo-dGTP diphosphatase [Candidatus Woesearchaeota archaeon]|nr:8-oxo-dGTP diphosphatase [Candidatus Woesearchaeota archaeon]